MALIRSHIIQIFWMILFVLNQDQKRLKYSGILMTFFYAMSKSLPGCQQEFYLDRVLIVASHLAYCKVNKRFWKGSLSTFTKFFVKTNISYPLICTHKHIHIHTHTRIHMSISRKMKLNLFWNYFYNNFHTFSQFDNLNPASA